MSKARRKRRKKTSKPTKGDGTKTRRGFLERVRIALTSEKEPRWERFLNRVQTVYWLIGLVVVVVVGILAIWRFVSVRPAALSLAFYEIDASGDPVISDGVFILEATDEQIAEGFVEIPLRFAVRNEGGRIAPVTRVVTRLRPDIDVVLGETATRKIDPTGQSIVYERPVSPLYPEADWTLFEEVDVIRVRIFSVEYPFATFSGGMVPILITTTHHGLVASRFDIGIPPVGDTELPITVEFFAADELIASSQLQLKIPFDSHVTTGYAGLSTATCSADLEGHVEELRDATPTREIRVDDFAGTTAKLRYAEYGPEPAVGQIAEVDGEIRFAYVDLDGNGLLDEGANWPVGGVPFCFRFEPQSTIEPWPDEAFEKP